MTIFIAFVCYIMMFFLILKKEERCWLLYKVKKMEEIISEKFFK